MELRTSPLSSSSTEFELELDTPSRSVPTTAQGEGIFSNREPGAGIEQYFGNDKSAGLGLPEARSGDFPDSDNESEDVVCELLAMVCKILSLPSSDVQYCPTAVRLSPRRLRLKRGLRERACGVYTLHGTIGEGF